MRQVVVLIGPTAVGKTDVAMALQDQLGGTGKVRLISADSVMVYRGMDIGTAKPSQLERSRYPHELIDIRDPAEVYTAADFVADADQCIASAFAEGQLPVLVGGTMLYAKRFVEGIAKLPNADTELRVSLQQEYDNLGGAVLHAELAAIDPQAAAGVHPNNPQRLLRALEIVRLTGQPMSAQWAELGGLGAVERLDAQISVFAVQPGDRKELHQRIEQRFDVMLGAGFVAELRALFARTDLHESLPAMRAVGYRQGRQFLAGELNADEFRAQAITATRRLAKRQLTWMRQWQGLHTLTWGEPKVLAGSIAKQIGRL